ncbi:MAG: hypothetical protein ACR2JB_10160 [Bryobacteraceae bacterium]
MPAQQRPNTIREYSCLLATHRDSCLTDLLVAEVKDAAQAHQIAAEAVPKITDYTCDVATFRHLQQELRAAAE